MSEPHEASPASSAPDPPTPSAERDAAAPSARSPESQIPPPSTDELKDIPADRRLELLELQRQRQDAERDRRRHSKHQWFNSIGILIGVLAAVAGLVTTAITWRIGQDQLKATREGPPLPNVAPAVR
ncbi:hypothetical protein GCM10009678_86550 [Actinomadura kijaniata]|uniref:Uncharacterized protein n=1 Tax=Actinomadura namibiensis TaxID=182080 RepID=A0A7W3M0R3_ACTNM|nr:hypothetical protein [Actinomadura namibiensis]MBA8957728.1 hypothetical protein [Actinomadura namibiensis]